MSQTTTPYTKKCEILSEVWFEFRNSEVLKEVIEYGDLGFPLAYAIAEKIIESSPLAENFVNDVWEMFLYNLSIEEDTGFESLDDVFLVSDIPPEETE